MKRIFITLILFVGMCAIKAEDEGLPDTLAQMPKLVEMHVKISREDCNYVYYYNVKGGSEAKLEWSKVKIKYDEVTQSFGIARDIYNIESNENSAVPNWVGAMSAYERVLSEKKGSKWEIDWSTYHVALCYLGLGQLDKAKERLVSIKNDSRWFYPAKLKVIDTLSEESKVQAMKDLLKSNDVTGPFKIQLNYMLVDKHLSDNKASEAKQAFEELKKLLISPDKMALLQLDEYQIKIDIMKKNYVEAEQKINQ